MLILNSQ